MKQRFPTNLKSLYEHEELLREKSIQAIEGSDELMAHSSLIHESMDVINCFCLQYKAQSEDELTIQLLGVRLLNSSASAIKLMLSGYYQSSTMQQRDLLETIFLLDYFSTDRGLIKKWRTVDERERIKYFKPFAVRQALDKRDGSTEKKREEKYKLLCKLAVHPSYEGFRMLTPKTGGDAQLGPFFEQEALRACYSELARHLLQAGIVFSPFFTAITEAAYQTKINFMETCGKWYERFYGVSFDPTKINEMRTQLEVIRNS